MSTEDTEMFKWKIKITNLFLILYLLQYIISRKAMDTTLNHIEDVTRLIISICPAISSYLFDIQISGAGVNIC